MALAPDEAPWYRRFRMLLVIYGLAMAIGAREYLLARSGAAVDLGTAEWTEMADVVAEINPTEADTEYLLAMEALRVGDTDAYVAHMESALERGVKHNNALLGEYAQFLIRTQAPFEDIDRALNRWRENHQLSFEILELPMGTGPTNQADQTALRGALDAIDWIYKYELKPPTEAVPYWVILTQFEPAVTPSIRELMEALSILSLPPEDRGGFAVRCTSFQDCRAIAR
jgi:hypothetical protein